LSITTDVAAILREHDEWTLRWASSPNMLEDEYGNHVALIEDDQSVRVEFEYAIPGPVEVLSLATVHGAHRIAAVIGALSAPPE